MDLWTYISISRMSFGFVFRKLVNVIKISLSAITFLLILAAEERCKPSSPSYKNKHFSLVWKVLLKPDRQTRERQKKKKKKAVRYECVELKRGHRMKPCWLSAISASFSPENVVLSHLVSRMSFRVASHTRSAWWLRTDSTRFTTGWRNTHQIPDQPEQASLARSQSLILAARRWRRGELFQTRFGRSWETVRAAGKADFSDCFKLMSSSSLCLREQTHGAPEQETSNELLLVLLLLQEEHLSLLSIKKKK